MERRVIVESETWNKENMSSVVRISVFEVFSNRSLVAFWCFVFVQGKGEALRQRPGRQSLNLAVFLAWLTKLPLMPVHLK